MQTLRKTGSYWAEEYAEVNKFPLACKYIVKTCLFLAIFRLLARKNI